jgi:hypothetical protein
MNNKFDELAKALAQSTTRRQALKRFSIAATGALLACFGLGNVAEAGHLHKCLKAGSPCGFTTPPCCTGVCNGYPSPGGFIWLCTK